jgi:hypothetical protein
LYRLLLGLTVFVRIAAAQSGIVRSAALTDGLNEIRTSLKQLETGDSAGQAASILR